MQYILNLHYILDTLIKLIKKAFRITRGRGGGWPIYLKFRAPNLCTALLSFTMLYMLYYNIRFPRIRTAFSPNQLLKLEQAFEKNQYVVGQERKELAKTLNLSETQVCTCVTATVRAYIITPPPSPQIMAHCVLLK